MYAGIAVVKLIDLEPQFLAVEDEKVSRHVDTFAEADGIMFVCPKCFTEKGERAGVHSVICWFTNRPRVLPERNPKPGRWPASGTGYADLTLTSSVLLTSGCGWHGYVTNGEVT